MLDGKQTLLMRPWPRSPFRYSIASVRGALSALHGSALVAELRVQPHTGCMWDYGAMVQHWYTLLRCRVEDLLSVCAAVRPGSEQGHLQKAGCWPQAQMAGAPAVLLHGGAALV